MEPKKVMLAVTLLEAAMIRMIRKYPFGTFRVIKEHGEPKRVIIEGSENLSETAGIELYTSQHKGYVPIDNQNKKG